MPNPGAQPLDANTAVGQLRATLGDTSFIDLDPVVAGQADYAVFSDVVLEAALLQAADSIPRAAGNLVLSLALEYGTKGRSIKTDDLSLDTKGRGADLLAVAKAFFGEADAADLAGAADYFKIVPFAGRAGCGSCVVVPEATPTPVEPDPGFGEGRYGF